MLADSRQRAHQNKAQKFIREAQELVASHPDMSIVCSFYALYHALSYSIRNADIWDGDISFLRKRRPDIRPEDRDTTHHSSSIRHGRGPGVRDLVRLFFPNTIVEVYEELHDASIDVRYISEPGRILPSARDAYADARLIVDKALAGTIMYRDGVG